MGGFKMSDSFVLSGECVSDQEPYLYRSCGLDDIYLVNGFDIEEDDGEKYVTIRDIDGLHMAIGKHLVLYRKALSPKEIKFLRKTMDLTQQELAEQLGKTSQSVARWEKGETEIPATAEKLLRVAFLLRCLSDQELQELRDFISRGMTNMDELDETINQPAQFCLGEHWTDKAAA
jgi:DNA-binding transcriptional regulator YiaG